MIVVLVNEAPEGGALKRVRVLCETYSSTSKVEAGTLQDGRLCQQFERNIVGSCKAASVSHGRVSRTLPTFRRDYPGVQVDRSADRMKLQDDRHNLGGNIDRGVRTGLTWIATNDHALIKGAIARRTD